MKLVNISLKKNVQYNDHLHPAIWDKNEKLKAEVRKKLIEIGEKFVEMMEIDDSAVEDYLLVGSAANYNWNRYSDIDLHILMDFKKVAECCDDELVEEFLMGKKAIWNSTYDIEIEGLKVEVGPQDLIVKLKSDGVYSLLENDWVNKPKKKEPELDEAAFDKKVKEMVAKIEKVLVPSATSAEIEKVRDEIKAMRKTSLGPSGNEFSTNNLVFKALRNQGLIDKLKNLEHEKTSEELSL